MSFNLSSLGPVAAAVAAAGEPVLAKVLGAVLPFPFNTLASTILDSLASAFGLPSSDPSAVASAITNDPNAAAKLQSVVEQHAADIASAQAIIDGQLKQDADELAVGVGFWQKVFFAGWRPAFCWLFIFNLAALLGTILAGRAIPDAFMQVFNWMASLFVAAMGLRTVDKITGVATVSFSQVVGAVKALRPRAAR